MKVGRTHLMDATPVRLGQVFGGYRQQIDNGMERVTRAMAGLEELALGGTAVGTGLNAKPGFAEKVCERVAGCFMRRRRIARRLVSPSNFRESVD